MSEPLPKAARTKYVVGFLVDSSRDMVILIRKNRPAWQAGKLNGVGGHVEEGETSYEAMVREFKEETGVTWLDWDLIVTMFFPGAVIHFYRGFAPTTTLGDIITERGLTDEEVDEYSIGQLLDYGHTQQDMIPNLRWLVPLAAYTADKYSPMTVHAQMANPPEEPHGT